MHPHLAQAVAQAHAAGLRRSAERWSRRPALAPPVAQVIVVLATILACALLLQ
jgi:hypothetical protein